MSTNPADPSRQCTFGGAQVRGILMLVVAMCGILPANCGYHVARNHFATVRWADDHAVNALFNAIHQGQVGRARLLLEKGVDVNGRDHMDYTPLMRAATCRNAELCRLLLDHGADLGASTVTGWSALMVAAGFSDERVLQLLLSRGAVVDAAVSPGRCTALMAACSGSSARAERAGISIDAGADVNAVSDNGTTPLINAASFGSAETGALLRRLVDAGADVNAADDEGRTALMETTIANSGEGVKLLLAFGADRNARDDSGLTARDLAERERCPVALAALKEATVATSAREDTRLGP